MAGGGLCGTHFGLRDVRRKRTATAQVMELVGHSPVVKRPPGSARPWWWFPSVANFF